MKYLKQYKEYKINNNMNEYLIILPIVETAVYDPTMNLLAFALGSASALTAYKLCYYTVQLPMISKEKID